MMKKIFSVALVAISMVSLPMLAQDVKGKESCEQTCSKKDKKANDEARKLKAEQREAEMFKGMNLTDSQKQQLRDLRESSRKAKKEKAEAMKAEKDKQKEAKKADRKAMKEQKEAERRAYLQEFKKIVGNENYVIFLENQFIMKSQPEAKVNKGARDIKSRKAAEMKKELRKFDHKDLKKDDTAKVKRGKKLENKV